MDSFDLQPSPQSASAERPETIAPPAERITDWEREGERRFSSFLDESSDPVRQEGTDSPPDPAPPRKPGRRVLSPAGRRRRRRRIRSGLLGFFTGVAAAGLLAVCVRVWERVEQPSDPFVYHYRDTYQQETGAVVGISIPTVKPGQDIAFEVNRRHGDSLAIQDIYRRVNPSVVTVLVGLSDETAAIGTGVIFSAEGYFLTNYHVVDGGQECTAMLENGFHCPAMYVAGDQKSDLAILKMDCTETLTAAEFGDSDLLTVGDDVYAIGNPLGIEFRGTLTNGIVSAINRDVNVDGRTMNLIQTNAALNSGNSGGPLINQFGQVVGINVVKMSSTHSTVEGLGFAIPSATMERLVNDLLTYGITTPEPVLGISVSRTPDELADGAVGISILTVTDGSAAQAAGLQIGDYILYADGEEIHSSQDLLRVRRRFHVGDELPMTIWREGEWMDVVLVLLQEE